MYQIAVCDDEQSDLRQSVQLTERLLQEADIPCAVTAYGSGVDLLREIQQGRHFDLLLLDVIMDALDGMALASHLKEQAAPPDIVFISTHRDMALLGYHVNAKRYLAKPLDRDELREALLGVLAQDPRPQYQHRPDRVYGLEFGPLEVKFTVEGELLTVRQVQNRRRG